MGTHRHGGPRDRAATRSTGCSTPPRGPPGTALRTPSSTGRRCAPRWRAPPTRPVWSGRTTPRSAHPARLAAELARAASELGVEIFEQTRVTGLVPPRRGAHDVVLRTLSPGGEASVRADRVLLGTGAFPSLLRRVPPAHRARLRVAIATEPLSADLLGAIGWRGRQGLRDLANRSHRYRLTADDRIVFGGHDAVYHYGGRMSRTYEDRPATFRRLTEHLLTTFPQLEGIRLTHRWSGTVDTATRPARVLRAGRRRSRAAQRRAGRARRRRRPLRRSGDARPARRHGRRRPTPNARGSGPCGGCPCRSRPSRWRPPGSGPRGWPWTGQTTRTDDATCCSGRSTRLAWGSIPDWLLGLSDVEGAHSGHAPGPREHREDPRPAEPRRHGDRPARRRARLRGHLVPVRGRQGAAQPRRHPQAPGPPARGPARLPHGARRRHAGTGTSASRAA